jgi:hypothetical protein
MAIFGEKRGIMDSMKKKTIAGLIAIVVIASVVIFWDMRYARKEVSCELPLLLG